MPTPRLVRASILLLILVGLAACGGSSDSGGNTGVCNPPFSDTLTGLWAFQETLFGNTCNTNGLNQGTWTVTQSGQTLTFIGASVWAATLCGSRATSNGQFSVPTNGGLHTVTQVTIQFQNENNATGTTRWSWANAVGGETCSGTSEFTMAR